MGLTKKNNVTETVWKWSRVLTRFNMKHAICTVAFKQTLLFWCLMKMVPFILTIEYLSHRGSFGVIDTDKWHYADSRDMIEGRNEPFRLFT